MADFFRTLVSIVSHPAITVGLVVCGGLTTWFVMRVIRLRRIHAHLRRLPPAQRRYTLERQYKIYPGTDGKPLFTVRRIHRRYWIAAVTTAVAAVVSVFGLTVERAIVAGDVQLAIDDASIVPERYGYLWRVRFLSKTTVPVAVTGVRVRVLGKSEHPESDHSWSDYGPAPLQGRRLLTLTPEKAEVDVLRGTGDIHLSSGQSRPLNLLIVANHKPNQGWIYDVRLEAEWKVAGDSTTRTALGHTYRLGWPGMSVSEDKEAADAPREAITDAVVAVDGSSD